MKTEFKSKKQNFTSSFGKKAVKDVIEYTSEKPEIESDSNDEINYLDKEFGKAKQKEIDSFNEQTSTAFYLNVYFKNQAQKEQFLKLAGLLDIVDEHHRFISGQEMCKKLNIPIDKVEIKSKGMFKVSKRFSCDEWFK